MKKGKLEEWRGMKKVRALIWGLEEGNRGGEGELRGVERDGEDTVIDLGTGRREQRWIRGDERGGEGTVTL